MRVGLLSFGYENFKCEVALKRFEKTKELLKEKGYEVITNDFITLDPKTTEDWIREFKKNGIEAIILQNGTFSDGNHIIKVMENIGDTPIILWGFPEPKAGEYNCIAINSMTAFNMFTSYLYKYKKKFAYVFGNIEEVQEELITNLKAIKVKNKLKRSKFCIIGGRAPGFYLSPVDELAFRKNFGVEIINYSLGELIRDCKEVPTDDIKRVKEEFLNSCGSFSASEEGLEKACRMYISLKNLAHREGIVAFSLKCWPEMQSLYNFAPCAVNGKLVSEGIMVSCEGDVTGLATMYIQHLLTDESVFFTDLVNLNENGSFKFWHCGCGPTALADGEIELIHQPTLPVSLGLATSFQFKRSEATVCKLKEDEGDYKLFMAKGKSIPVDRIVPGNQSDIVFDADKKNVMDAIVRNGIEHHYSIVYKDIVKELKALCYWTDVKEINPV